MSDVRVIGAVLTGGASRRMGTDKALVEVGGRPLVAVAAAALRGAGADPVLAVGGDPTALAAADPEVRPVPDRHPGEGPLGGLLTAFAAATDVVDGEGAADGRDLVVVVVACDMPALDDATVAALVDALVAAPGADLAAAVADGRPQPLTAAWRPGRAASVLARAFAAGERAPRRLLDRLRTVGVPDLDPEALADVDRPEDLRRYADPAPAGPGATPGD